MGAKAFEKCGKKQLTEAKRTIFATDVKKKFRMQGLYMFDAAGNRKTKTINKTGTTTYDYNGANGFYKRMENCKNVLI